MALGGGTWQTQNKKLPGYYHNVISLKRASANLSDRGIVAVPLNLKWGEVGKVVTVERNDFFKASMKLFGYDYTADEMLPLREIFKNATKVYCYRLGATVISDEKDGSENTDNSEEVTGDIIEGTETVPEPEEGLKQAKCTYATAKYPGTRGNSIRIVIEKSIDNEALFVVKTYVDSVCYDTQTVSSANSLVNNSWVEFNKNANLTAIAGINLSGGKDGEPTGADYQSFLTSIERYNYNILCCPAKDPLIVDLFTAFTKSQREDYGVKFQLVAFEPQKADYEGIIGVWNKSEHPLISTASEQSLVYWTAGAQAGCSINKTLTNRTYDGELSVDVEYTQSELENAITSGRFVFHNVNGEIRVLEDINTLVNLSDTKGDIFQSNQTIRIADQISNDIAVLFNTQYLGKVQNDKIGRNALWNDVVCYHRKLESLRAIEDFDPESVICEIGETKKSVVLTTNGLKVVNAMSQLYMTTVMQ